MNKSNNIKLVNNNGTFGSLVPFSINKNRAIHRWFTLVEGFSSELVRRIIGEQKNKPVMCLDPFGGVGTTSLTCQDNGIECKSFEINPFFYDVAKAKLNTNYNPYKFEQLIDKIESSLKNTKTNYKLANFETKTIYKSNGRNKWLINKSVEKGILDIIYQIDKIRNSHSYYHKLFRVVLASIIVDISNVFRNGKCLSFKKDWKKINIKRRDVHIKFLNVCRQKILIDLRTSYFDKTNGILSNYNNYLLGDARELVKKLPNNYIDLVITSPPYLNSRDYTDIYRLELWILGYVSTYKQERELRKSTIRSHVQIPWEDCKYPKSQELDNFVKHLTNIKGSLWNKSIPNMVKGYFNDMYDILYILKRKLKRSAKLYFNVANSAYGGKICEVDVILTKIAKSIGYKPIEIRITRYLKSSSQQKLTDRLRESIVVIENK